MRVPVIFAVTAAFLAAPAALAAPARLSTFEDFNTLQARADGQWTKAIGNTNVGLMAANAAVNIASTIKKLIGKDELSQFDHDVIHELVARTTASSGQWSHRISNLNGGLQAVNTAVQIASNIKNMAQGKRDNGELEQSIYNALVARELALYDLL